MGDRVYGKPNVHLQTVRQKPWYTVLNRGLRTLLYG
jgi:hypothetical protein